MTKAQKELLTSMAQENLAVLDVTSGGMSQCIQRLKRAGFVEFVVMRDWRDDYYRITDAGRDALNNQ